MSPTPLQTFSVVAGFSALSAWYGYMFGKEAARKELGTKIDELRDENSKLKNAVDSIKAAGTEYPTRKYCSGMLKDNQIPRRSSTDSRSSGAQRIFLRKRL
ncbi:hypothetical protein R1flu_007128 [Riccia fluitans]|uniref:Uncharacterized protein n=1 Tax=Riccia fluitans TaxID=41844 RepID=A0ABD1Z0M7_9MARC